MLTDTPIDSDSDRPAPRSGLGNALFFSLNLHLFVLLMVLLIRQLVPSPPAPPPEAVVPAELAQKVFLPPPDVLRRLVAPPPPAPKVAQTRPTEPPVGKKDRMSVGSPDSERAKDRLLLRREDDLTAIPKGRPDAERGTPTPPPQARSASGPRPDETSALPLPPGQGSIASGRERLVTGQGPSSLSSSLRNLDEKLRQSGDRGVVSGTGQQMGPLFFDPQGADFTAWINHFKNEVYRNWIVPQPALMGFRGHVDIQFVVARDGSIRDLKVLKSSGMAALDRAAHNALAGSQFLALPADYGPDLITMQVAFYYNEGPERS